LAVYSIADAAVSLGELALSSLKAAAAAAARTALADAQDFANVLRANGRAESGLGSDEASLPPHADASVGTDKS